MSDQLYLTGPEANVDKEEFIMETERAENCDCSEIQKEMAKAFCTEPKKTISEMTDQEVLEHKFALEATIRKFRIHLQHTVNAVSKRRKTSGKLTIDKLEKTIGPKPIPTSRQANNEDMKLAERIAEKKDISIEEALKIIRGVGEKEDIETKTGPENECDFCDKPATEKNKNGKACKAHKKELK